MRTPIDLCIAPDRQLSSALIAAAVVSGGAGGAEAAKTSIVIGMTVEPSGLDPTVAAPVAIGQVTWQNIFEGLLTIDRDGKILHHADQPVEPIAGKWGFSIADGSFRPSRSPLVLCHRSCASIVKQVSIYPGKTSGQISQINVHLMQYIIDIGGI